MDSKQTGHTPEDLLRRLGKLLGNIAARLAVEPKAESVPHEVGQPSAYTGS